MFDRDDNDESEMVSESQSGQGAPPPSRLERDAAYSAGAGRKAIEVPKQLQEVESQTDDNEEPPVGLDLETRGYSLSPKAHH